MSTESMPREHPLSGGVSRGRKTEPDVIPVQTGDDASYEGGGPAVNHVGDFIARHPAESMAMATAAGVLTGVALEIAPKAAAKAITTAIVGTAAVGFVSALRGLGDDPREVLTIDRVCNAHSCILGRRGESREECASRPDQSPTSARSASRVMSPDFIDEWMETPNQAFSGLKPLEVWERGEEDRIWGMIFYLESGIPG